MKINDIPVEIRPREKAIRLGVESLSDQELLAIIIGSGVKGKSVIEISNDLLQSYNNSMFCLANANLASLLSFYGLKKANALKLLATFEFHNRLNSIAYQKVAKISSPEEVYIRYQYLEKYEQEVLILLLLDSRGKIKQEKLLYKGTFDGFSINTSEIVREIVIGGAKSFIIIHNHPDGCPEASIEDRDATNLIERAAKQLGIRLVDHVIIYKGGYCSIKQIKKTKK